MRCAISTNSNVGNYIKAGIQWNCVFNLTCAFTYNKNISKSIGTCAFTYNIYQSLLARTYVYEHALFRVFCTQNLIFVLNGKHIPHSAKGNACFKFRFSLLFICTNTQGLLYYTDLVNTSILSIDIWGEILSKGNIQYIFPIPVCCIS